jgi:serine/threonine protein kinase
VSRSEAFLTVQLESAKHLHWAFPQDAKKLKIASWVCRWSIQLANALGYLHEKGILYRDLSAGNVLLTSRKPSEADIKLIDFGLHKRVEDLKGCVRIMGRSGIF